MGKYVQNEAINNTDKKTPNINHFSKLEQHQLISNYCALTNTQRKQIDE